MIKYVKTAQWEADYSLTSSKNSNFKVWHEHLWFLQTTAGLCQQAVSSFLDILLLDGQLIGQSITWVWKISQQLQMFCYKGIFFLVAGDLRLSIAIWDAV